MWGSMKQASHSNINSIDLLSFSILIYPSSPERLSHSVQQVATLMLLFSYYLSYSKILGFLPSPKWGEYAPAIMVACSQMVACRRLSPENLQPEVSFPTWTAKLYVINNFHFMLLRFWVYYPEIANEYRS